MPLAISALTVLAICDRSKDGRDLDGRRYNHNITVVVTNIQHHTAKLDIITVYRSDSEPEFRAAHHLSQLIEPDKDTLVVGDLNYCAAKERKDLSRFFAREGFSQLVTLPTHIGGGIHMI